MCQILIYVPNIDIWARYKLDIGYIYNLCIVYMVVSQARKKRFYLSMVGRGELA